MRNKETVTDSRFKAIKPLIENKIIKSFDQIFWHIPKTIVAVRLGVKGQRFDAFIENPGLLRVNQAKQLAVFFKVKTHVMMDLVCVERRKPKVLVNHRGGARTRNKENIPGNKISGQSRKLSTKPRVAS